MIFWGSRVKHRKSPRKTVPLQRRMLRSLEGRFALPNLIWKQDLKPAEFMILACIYFWYKQGVRSTTETAELIAERVHLSEATVKKHLAVLVGKGLVASEFSFVPTIPAQPDGNFFSLPDEVFSVVRLSACAFVVYAYLLYVENRRTHTCHPSFRTMAAGTGLSVKTVEKHIGTLVDKDLILVENTSYLDKNGMKWNVNNEYTILSLCYAQNRPRDRWGGACSGDRPKERDAPHHLQGSARQVPQTGDWAYLADQ